MASTVDIFHLQAAQSANAYVHVIAGSGPRFVIYMYIKKNNFKKHLELLELFFPLSQQTMLGHCHLNRLGLPV